MSNSIINSFNNCHKFFYNTNVVAAFSIPPIIGVITAIAATRFVFKMFVNKEEDWQNESGVMAGGFFGLGAGYVAGMATFIISGIAIIILKLVPPRV